jgi:beta-glucosidase-like glycosyl hydrolase
VLRTRDLPPFAAVVEAGAKALMTAHIRVPLLTGDGPATFSRAVLHDLLRHEYGFTGAVVTDALEMAGAAVPAGGVGPAAVRALRAGADLLCIGARVDAALVEAVAASIAGAVASGELDQARAEEAAIRADGLATWATLSRAGPLVRDGIGYAAARRAVRVEGTLIGLLRPLVVQLVSSSTIAEGPVPWGLAPHLAGAEQLRVVAATADADALRARAGDRPIVVVGRHVHRLPGGRELVEALAARHPVTVVEMGWPSAWRPAGVRAFVTTYGASHANGRAAAEVLGLVPPVPVDLAG